MTQLHFSVDEATAKALAEQARLQGKSLSKYLADIVVREVPSSWPPGYLDSVLGSLHPRDLVEPGDPEPGPVNL